MGRRITIGNPPIDVDLRRSVRARRMSLRVSRLDGKVSLTMPVSVAEREALDFLHEREDWLRKHVSNVAPKDIPQIGGQILFKGALTPIVAGKVTRAVLREAQLVVPADGAATAAKLKAFLKLQARDALAAASDHYAGQLGRRFHRLSLRDTRSRWGSCSHKGVLMYSWRLIMAPPEVLDYVAAHEVSHLAEMNHSDAFWAVVAGLMPDYQRHRTWLRQNGDQLHRTIFDN